MIFSQDISLSSPSTTANTANASSTAAVGLCSSSSSEEVVTTIYIAGFPDDFSEREFHNLFAFASGYEGCALKIPPSETDTSTSSAAPDPPSECGAACKTNGSNSLSNSNSSNGRGQILGFARFTTVADAIEACRILNGRVLDAERPTMLRVEMAKKNLHLGPVRARSYNSSYSSSMANSYAFNLSNACTTPFGLPLPSFNVTPSSSLMGSNSSASSSGRGIATDSGENSAMRPWSHFELNPIRRSSDPTAIASIACSHLTSPIWGSSSLLAQDSSPNSADDVQTNGFNLDRQMRSLSLNVPGHEDPVAIAAPRQTQRSATWNCSLDQCLFDAAESDESNASAVAESNSKVYPPRNSSFSQGHSMMLSSCSPTATFNPVDGVLTSSNGLAIFTENPPCNTLYVGNLPNNTSELELRQLFTTVPGYRRLSFKNKPGGGSPMCFVEFEDISTATSAMESLYGTPLSNSTKGGIRLSYSKNPLGVRASSSFGYGHGGSSFQYQHPSSASSSGAHFVASPHLHVNSTTRFVSQQNMNAANSMHHHHQFLQHSHSMYDPLTACIRGQHSSFSHMRASSAASFLKGNSASSSLYLGDSLFAELFTPPPGAVQRPSVSKTSDDDDDHVGDGLLRTVESSDNSFESFAKSANVNGKDSIASVPIKLSDDDNVTSSEKKICDDQLLTATDLVSAI